MQMHNLVSLERWTNNQGKIRPWQIFSTSIPFFPLELSDTFFYHFQSSILRIFYELRQTFKDEMGGVEAESLAKSLAKL